ncbi:hypothetical protein DRN38_07795 [Thermococci archaeon]|nr:MAG: hypothetical protein DRN38_07795 [Thermococci archaeon]
MFKVWYHDNRTFAEYLIETTKLNEHDPKIERISTGRDFANNPDMIQKILYLDMPDAVVTYGFPEKPILGIEFCAEAPSGHDIFQRVARVAASASFGTAFAFIFPEKKWVVRTIGGRWDNYNPLVMRALMHISRFHKVPSLSFFWEADILTGVEAEGFLRVDENYENMPDRESEEMKNFTKFVNLAIDYVLQNRDFREMMFDPFILEREAWMWEKYHQRYRSRPNIFRWSPLTSCRKIETSELISLIEEVTGRRPNLPHYVSEREETIIYEPGTRQFRSDPYSGSLVGIDYLMCRRGETVRHRHRNLAMRFRNVSFAKMQEMFVRYYRDRCPFNPGQVEIDRYLTLHLKDGCRYTKQKELRIYCYIADLLIFRDAALY